LKKDWVADSQAFEALVEWLDGSGGIGGEGGSYVAMHGRLASYFTRKGCRAPEELADEALTRVARRLSEEGTIAGVVPAQYCYIVARFVWLEHLRSPDYAPAAVLGEVRDRSLPADEGHERMLASLDDCLGQLTEPERTIILGYYAGATTERMTKRRDLAAKFGLTANALTIKASRLRERLRACMGGQERKG
jgi:DNA-directed RNA polymerase specialized sigma24 family protein